MLNQKINQIHNLFLFFKHNQTGVPCSTKRIAANTSLFHFQQKLHIKWIQHLFFSSQLTQKCGPYLTNMYDVTVP